MPSPNTSPTMGGGESPSAIVNNRDPLSPTVPSMNNNDADADGVLGESLDGMEGNSSLPTRRSLMSVMRNAVGGEVPRRRSRGVPQNPQIGQGDELFSSFVMNLAGNGANGFEAIANNIAVNAPRTTRHVSPLRNKVVYQLQCRYCVQRVCTRAMKAILLADTKIELYSTDIPPVGLHLLEDDRMTQGCHCRIRDTACTCCGNVLGYHVSQPCEKCLDAKNNGHFWMFYSETISPYERIDGSSGKPLHWGSLSPMREHDETMCPNGWRQYEMYCR